MIYFKIIEYEFLGVFYLFWKLVKIIGWENNLMCFGISYLFFYVLGLYVCIKIDVVVFCNIKILDYIII